MYVRKSFNGHVGDAGSASEDCEVRNFFKRENLVEGVV